MSPTERNATAKGATASNHYAILLTLFGIGRATQAVTDGRNIFLEAGSDEPKAGHQAPAMIPAIPDGYRREMC